MHHTHLLVVLLVPLLVLSAVFASDAVTTYPSGIFRGSMLHIVAIGALSEGGVLVSGVNAGDFLSFRKPGRVYARNNDVEPGQFYIRAFDRGEADAVKYDFNTEKYRSLSFEEILLLDVDFDGIDDVALQFSGIDLRSGAFMVSVPAQDVPEIVNPLVNDSNDSEVLIPENESESEVLPCDVACSVDADCSSGAQCVRAGTCGAKCESLPGEEPAPDTPPVVKEKVVRQSLFSRSWAWLKSLF